MGIPTAPLRSLAISTAGNNSQKLWTNTTTSTSIVERSVPVCNFDCQRTGQFVKVITKHVPPTPNPTSALPLTPPSKPISYTKKNPAVRAVCQQVYSCGRRGHVGMLSLQPRNLLLRGNALPNPRPSNYQRRRHWDRENHLPTSGYVHVVGRQPPRTGVHRQDVRGTEKG